MIRFFCYFLSLVLLCTRLAYSSGESISSSDAVSEAMQKRIEEYISTSFIVEKFLPAEKEKARKALYDTLSARISKNGNRWPEAAQLSRAEQFYWKFDAFGSNYKFNLVLIKIFFAKDIYGNPEDFEVFAAPYIAAEFVDARKPYRRWQLFDIYQVLPDAGKRREFEEFCKPYIGMATDEQVQIMQLLLPIYQALPDAGERREFEEFCKPYVATSSYRASALTSLLPVYHAFPDPDKRREFVDFSKPYLIKVEYRYQPNALTNLAIVYQSFPDERKRHGFLLTRDYAKGDFRSIFPDHAFSTAKAK